MYWFNNKGLIIFFLIKLESEICHFMWKDPGLREKIVFLTKHFEHSHQVSAKIIFPSQSLHTWVMICSLIGLHFRKLFRKETLGIVPVEIPIPILIIHKFVAQLPTSSSHYHISHLCCAQVYLSHFLFLFFLTLFFLLLFLFPFLLFFLLRLSIVW